MSSNGLKKGCEIVLKNENGGTWNLVLRHNKSNNTTVISGGWRSFCQANGIKARDPFMFKLVKTAGKPVLCLCPTESNRDTSLVACSEGNNANSLSTNASSGEESSETEESEENSIEDITVKEENEEESIEEKSSLRECLKIEKWKYCSRSGASSSSSQNRFVTLTITPYSVKSNKMVSLKVVYYSIGFEFCSAQSFCLDQIFCAEASTTFHESEWHQQSGEDNSVGSRWSKMDGASGERKRIRKNEIRKRLERIL